MPVKWGKILQKRLSRVVVFCFSGVSDKWCLLASSYYSSLDKIDVLHGLLSSPWLLPVRCSDAGSTHTVQGIRISIEISTFSFPELYVFEDNCTVALGNWDFGVLKVISAQAMEILCDWQWKMCLYLRLYVIYVCGYISVCNFCMWVLRTYIHMSVFICAFVIYTWHIFYKVHIMCILYIWIYIDFE